MNVILNHKMEYKNQMLNLIDGQQYVCIESKDLKCF